MIATLALLLSLADTPRFQKTVIASEFRSEGVAVGDINRDGKLDIIAGAYWYQAPDWTPHEIDQPQHKDPAHEYSNSFLDYVSDVDHDGWLDMIRIGLPGEELVWYQNPGASVTGHWKMFPLLDFFGNESPTMVDINDDGSPDLLGNDPSTKEVIWLEAPVKKGDTHWTRHSISKGETGTGRYTHGLGFIDMNGDGRRDVVMHMGWWERPADARTENWVFHPEDIAPECAQILSPDQPGKAASTLYASSAHDYGVWRMKRDGVGKDAKWNRTTLYDQVSETHSLAFVDLNGDGRPDLVSGKRWYAHNGGDPGGKDAAVLFWLEQGKDANSWTPHIIDNDSGVGLQVLVQDMNGDGKPDIVISNKKGLFLFLQL